MRLFTIRALFALALLMIAAPMLAQTSGATPDRTLQRASVARTIQALRMMRGVDYTMARTAGPASPAKDGARLLGAGGSISGTVSMPPGTRDFATVIAVPADSVKEDLYVIDAQIDGSYSIDGVPAGSYIVLAQSSLCQPEFYDNVGSIDSATLVSVREGQATTGIDFSLETTPVGEGSITGKVLTEVGGDAIYGASVWAMSMTNPNHGGWAEVDASGDFVISGLFSGDYVLQASAPGFLSEFYDDARTFESATTVSVSEPGTTSGVIFSLSAGATISGRIVDGDGNPLAGASISAMQNGGRDGDSAFPSPGTGFAVSDENGDYVISGLDSGAYIVSAAFWGTWLGVQEYYDDVTDPEQATPVRAVLGQTTSGIDFDLEIPSFDGVLRGVVLDTAGRPIEGAFVMLVSTLDVFPVRMGVSTGADGSYVIEGLPDGAYEVSAMAQSGWQMVNRWWRDAETPDEADLVTIINGVSDVASVDFALPLDRGTASISGTVTLADGSPVSGAMIGVIVTDPSDSTVLFGASAMSDENGEYTLPFLPDGSYLVYASYWEGELMGTEWYLNASDPSTATPVVLADDEVRTGVDFSLDLRSWRGTITGRVTDDRTGAPIARAYVEIAPTGEVAIDAGFGKLPAYALTDDDGRYVIEGAPAGEYFVAVIGNGTYEYFDGATHPDSATTLVLVGGDTAVADFGLTAVDNGDGSISGRVFSNDGRPMEVGLVVAFPTNANEEIAFPTVGESTGSYAITGLADGDYFVFAFSPEHIGEYYEDAWDVSEATVVSVRNGLATTGIDFGLDGWGCVEDDGQGAPGAPKGGVVYGEVTDNSGRAIVDANVYVVDANRKAVASVRTKADGTYEVSGLPLGGEYRVMASSVGYASEYNGDARSFEEAAPKQVRQGRTEINFELTAGTSAVGDVEERASGIAIAGSYPNPFATSTAVRFSLEKAMDLDITVVDARGETVAKLHDGTLDGGSHELRWDGRRTDGTLLGSGIYFVRIANGAASKVVPVTIAR
ncbi:MAG TPA: carboxypeptidase regulatory-like domain-containing protein [Candidatus Kapabacteria bacterium]|nr:carboxypeptidase regulatory-like domain-containing protein [Candidatus Kapabacteria bacterium]